ncbi:hydrogenase maturation protease [Thiotrichales bacterium 19S3-7]|nr:hydrogenase maturation protease [Thiotrichales bacterium 19S3-7]MCF6802052.1 hydrogenase maturation protease [Thiotrichales bacterium 19S3-11]
MNYINNPKHKPTTLILGIGSPFSDDQFGFKVAQYLKGLVGANLNIMIEIADRPGLNLLSYLNEDYQKVILIDAVNANQKPGTSFYFKADEITQFNGFLSSHNLGIAYALSLHHALGHSLNHIHFYGVQAKYLSQKDINLSDEVIAQIQSTANKIINHI